MSGSLLQSTAQAHVNHTQHSTPEYWWIWLYIHHKRTRVAQILCTKIWKLQWRKLAPQQDVWNDNENVRYMNVEKLVGKVYSRYSLVWHGQCYTYRGWMHDWFSNSVSCWRLLRKFRTSRSLSAFRWSWVAVTVSVLLPGAKKINIVGIFFKNIITQLSIKRVLSIINNLI